MYFIGEITGILTGLNYVKNIDSVCKNTALLLIQIIKRALVYFLRLQENG